MKKLISAILSASMIAASAAVPVFADYEVPEESYDITAVNNTYNDGNVINDIDGSNALQTGETFERIFSTSIDTTKEFYLGFDFRFDNESGQIEVPSFKSNGSVDKVGPIISFDGTNLRTQTSSSSYQQLGAFTTGEWYSAEIEGRTGIGAKYTTFRLYSYSEGEKTLVQETTNLNMRNLSSENRRFNGMQARNISIDNVLLVQEKPDTITLSATSDDMNAGTDAAFDYIMTRLGKEFNKYAVTWSVYDESDTVPLEDGNIAISSAGILSVGINCPPQTVTVRATAEFGDKELHGSKQMIINSVDVADEKFDTIAVSGSETAKAGESTEFTFTAAKDGTDVTDTLSASDISWSIYDSYGIEKNNNRYITVENGVLTLDESIIPQTITVRASSASGAVYGQKTITTSWADSQKETVLSYDACEAEKTNTTLVDSWDGSKAYSLTDSVTFGFGDQTKYTVTDVDIKFGASGGLTLYNNNGSENSNIRVNGSQLAQQTSSSKWTVILSESEFDPQAWYHIEFLYLNGNESGYNVYKYNDDGTKALVKTIANCNRRNDKPYGKITFTAGNTIDNFKVALAAADSVTIISPGQYAFSGETAQFGASSSRSGLTMANAPGLTWRVYDAEMLPIIDGSVTVSEDGLVAIDSMTAAQNITVRVSSASGAYADAVLTIQVAEIFTVTNLGVNEERTAVTKLYVDKNFYYNDDVTFIITIKDSDGVLKAVKLISTFGDRFSLGSNEITTELALPSDFDPGSDVVEAMVWTAL